PLASASIAQVHRARLKDGSRVVLKVRRPGIKAIVDADLRILAYVADLLETEVPEARRYQPKEILSQFANSLERELDLAMEARNIERFGHNFRDDTSVLVPKVYWDWTSTRMNVQEYIEAIPGNDREAIEAAGLDRQVIARRGAEMVLKMILVDGFFHADPHPGNVFYLPGNRVVLIDCGMVGRLTRFRRNQIVDLLSGVARRDEEAMLDVVMEWTGEADVDETRLAADLGELLFDYADAPIRDLRIAVLLHKITEIVRKHSVVLPPDLALLFKALITLEGLGRQYDPEFRLTEHLAPLLERAVGERFEPKSIISRGRHSAGQIYNLMTSVPKDLARILKEARRGRMRVDLDMKRLDTFGQQLDESIDRITVGIMTASLVIGSSIVMTITSGPQLFGVPLFTWLGLLGYLMAFCNSLWILYGIWRSRRFDRKRRANVPRQ
ncbi:MAG: AarF/UbiB family protein, partial [Gammaproteobacteria bacterium]|nr:AarF/UbiB family protein [Gammaproteobacteria bacterium]